MGWPGAKTADPTCYETYGGAGWKFPESGTSTRSSTPVWVKGPPGQDCLTACAAMGGCKGAGWPMTASEFQTIKTSLNDNCNTDHNAFPFNPSAKWSSCGYKMKGIDPMYRCGAKPPRDVSRFCPCNEPFNRKEMPTWV